jgi:hypothetical protein
MEDVARALRQSNALDLAGAYVVEQTEFDSAGMDRSDSEIRTTGNEGQSKFVRISRVYATHQALSCAEHLALAFAKLPIRMA